MHYNIYRRFLKHQLSMRIVKLYPSFPGRLVLTPCPKTKDLASVLSLGIFSFLNKSFCLAFSIVQKKKSQICPVIPFHSSSRSHSPAINGPLFNFPASESEISSAKGDVSSPPHSTLFLLTFQQVPPPALRRN